MRLFRYTCTFAIVCALILILVACGGGGSEDLPPDRQLDTRCNQTAQPCNR
jgi:hypothetical protein